MNVSNYISLNPKKEKRVRLGKAVNPPNTTAFGVARHSRIGGRLFSHEIIGHAGIVELVQNQEHMSTSSLIISSRLLTTPNLDLRSATELHFARSAIKDTRHGNGSLIFREIN